LGDVVQHADERDGIPVEGRLSVGSGLHGLGPLAIEEVAPGAPVEQVFPAAGSVEGLAADLALK